MPRYDRVQPGKPISAGILAGLAGGAMAASRRRGPGPATDGGGNPTWRRAGDGRFNARLGGKANPYDLTEVIGTPGGGWSDAPGGIVCQECFAEYNGIPNLGGQVIMGVRPAAPGGWKGTYHATGLPPGPPAPVCDQCCPCRPPDGTDLNLQFSYYDTGGNVQMAAVTLHWVTFASRGGSPSADCGKQFLGFWTSWIPAVFGFPAIGAPKKLPRYPDLTNPNLPFTRQCCLIDCDGGGGARSPACAAEYRHVFSATCCNDTLFLDHFLMCTGSSVSAAARVSFTPVFEHSTCDPVFLEYKLSAASGESFPPCPPLAKFPDNLPQYLTF